MKIIIVRHAEPDYAVDELTGKGVLEAQMLASRLMTMDVDDIYSSPFGRAQATAKPYSQKVCKNVQILDWLSEFQGVAEDSKSKMMIMPWDLKPEYWQKDKDLYNLQAWADSKTMSGGTIKEKYYWVTSGLDELLKKYGYIRSKDENKPLVYTCEKNQEKTIVLFCHFALGMVLISHLTGVSPTLLWQGFFMPASSMTTLVTEERQKGEVIFRTVQVGDTSHLYKNNEPISKMGLFPETFTEDKKDYGSKC